MKSYLGRRTVRWQQGGQVKTEAVTSSSRRRTHHCSSATKRLGADTTDKRCDTFGMC